MNFVLMGLFAETSLHPGAEASSGVVDLPVAREATTSYPVLMGSGLKGALRDCYENSKGREQARKEAEEIFGRPDGAGGVAVTDGRLLLLPVRSLTGHYRWVTCPYILERFERDLDLAGESVRFHLPGIEAGQALAAAESGNLYLEELSFTTVESRDIIEGVTGVIAGLICHQSVRDHLVDRLVIIKDDEFQHFARFGLPVNARNVLNDNTKTSQNLWYEETIPPDTLFYALLISRPGKDGQLDALKALFTVRPYLQVGGNETVGQGWCAVSWLARG